MVPSRARASNIKDSVFSLGFGCFFGCLRPVECADGPGDAYPGFRPLPGPAAEYKGKFMVNQLVLRGSSFATPAGLALVMAALVGVGVSRRRL